MARAWLSGIRADWCRLRASCGWIVRRRRLGARRRPNRCCRSRSLKTTARSHRMDAGWRISPMNPASPKSTCGRSRTWIPATGRSPSTAEPRPVWAQSGKELFYLDGRAITSVPVQTAPSFSAGTPTKLFDGPYFTGLASRTYDVSPDGQRFLMIKDNASGDQTSDAAECRCRLELGQRS